MSWREISAKVGVPKSTANNIFNHAVQNAVAKRKRLEEDAAGSAGSAGEELPPAKDPDKTSDFLAGIDDELNSLYSRECIVEKEKRAAEAAVEVPIAEQQVSLVELLAPDCLDPHPRPGRPRVAPEEKARRKKEKKEAAAAARGIAKQTPAEQDTTTTTTPTATSTAQPPPLPPQPEREPDNRWVNYNFTDAMQIESAETFVGGPLVWGDCMPESC
ncbi:hypothetical protein K440DRAFT_627325 [Wilcoxina mikolae CBS 423.85]|nr:hypothetical protein K440DRAFT_627325 [Wilcoxina mikolae CBS 423.85]